MNVDEQNLAVAEFCGYRNLKPNTNWLTKPDGTNQFFNPMEVWYLDLIPDYGSDLNAMAKARKKLSKEQKEIYEVALREVICGKCGFWYVPHSGEVFQIIDATAAQHREAFVRAIGKWKE